VTQNNTGVRTGGVISAQGWTLSADMDADKLADVLRLIGASNDDVITTSKDSVADPHNGSAPTRVPYVVLGEHSTKARCAAAASLRSRDEMVCALRVSACTCLYTCTFGYA
jgi:hypothetical protein